MYVCMMCVYGGERKRIIDVREKHRSVASRMVLNWGSGLQPRHVP